MSILLWRTLIDNLCKLTAIPNPQTLYEHTALQIANVGFTLIHDDGSGAGNILLYGDMGALPLHRREAIVIRLMELNFELAGRPFSPVFSFNAQSQKINLTAVLMLEFTSAERLLEIMDHLADMAIAWRADFFLDSPQSQVAMARSQQKTRLR